MDTCLPTYPSCIVPNTPSTPFPPSVPYSYHQGLAMTGTEWVTQSLIIAGVLILVGTIVWFVSGRINGGK